MTKKINENFWSNYELSEKEAIAIYESKIWEHWTPEELVLLQLFQPRVCVDFDHFTSALETVLDRKITTLELADREKLILEYLKVNHPPSIQEIIDSIPPEKLTIIKLP